MSEIIYSLMEIIGTVAFAISGAVVGIKKKMDILGIIILGLSTAVGGGIIRDIVIGKTPPTAFIDYKCALIAVITSIIIFIIWPYLKKHQNFHSIRENLLMIMDTIGLGIFTVNGIRCAYYYLEPNINFFLLIFVGVVTGVGGGVIRDIFANEPPSIFHKHFYATASIIGAIITIETWLVCSEVISMLLGCFIIIILRVLAVKYRWNLPKAKD